MKMSEIQVGQIYNMADFRGKHGTTILSRRVRVLETYVQRDRYRDRKDGVRVMLLKAVKDENGEITGYEDDTRHDGEPWERIIMARELVTIEEAEARFEEIRKQNEERKQRAFQNDKLEEVAERMIAERLGISAEVVTATFITDDDMIPAETVPWRLSIDAKGVAAVLKYDDDADRIIAALNDHYSVGDHNEITATPAELAAAIVAGMRNGS